MAVSASVRWIEETESTNTLLSSCCDSLPSGVVICARRQSAGRGQRGNTWESEPYANLTFSMLLRPSVIEASRQFEMSMIVSIAVCDALEKASGESFMVKWPNDIYAGDKKICGILIENSLAGRRISHSVVGIGINVNQRRFVSDAPNPVSLINLTRRSYDLESLLVSVCDTILRALETYESSPDPVALTAAYRSRLWRGEGFHRWHDVSRDEIFEAAIDDVAASGILTLKDRGESRRSYAFKEVSAVL